jgi:hypothetical protein
MSLVNASGERVARRLTSAGGRAQLVAPSGGSFRVRAERIGFEPFVSDPIRLDSGAVMQYTLRFPSRRVALPRMTITSASECRIGGDEGGRAATLWAEARKALEASELTAEQSLVVAELRSYRNLRNTFGFKIREVADTVRVLARRPFAAVSADELSERGYVQGIESDTSYFYGPDATVLLSERFFDEHCLSAVAHPKDRKLVGLAFAPPSSRVLPDVTGTLWLDATSGELRFVEFTYVNLPKLMDVKGLGGRLDLQRVASGAWIVSSWHIRMPWLVHGPLPDGSMKTELRGSREQGAEVIRLLPGN